MCRADCARCVGRSVVEDSPNVIVVALPDVDTSEAPMKILHAAMSLPAKSGSMSRATGRFPLTSTRVVSQPRGDQPIREGAVHGFPASLRHESTRHIDAARLEATP